MRDVLTFLMAGGRGDRLLPLTQDQAKPAVPFGGIYRIIDFTLSNCVNSGVRKIHVLTQYKSISLIRHLWKGWSHIFNPELGEFLDIVHPQQRIDDSLYQGTADSVFQNLDSIRTENPEFVLILAGDHIYKLDYWDMVAYHLETQAEVTVGVVRRPITESRMYGVARLTADARITDFLEKPDRPESRAGSKDEIFASMGIYLFSRRVLEEELAADARKETDHDFGKNILPNCVRNGRRVVGFQFDMPRTGRPAYWRDVGTLDGYYEANMELLKPDPPFTLNDRLWPVRTYQEQRPPAKFTTEEGSDSRQGGQATDSLISAGCRIGGAVRRSVLSPNVRVETGARVEDSILMEGVTVGREAKIRRAIIDQGVTLPAGIVIGENHQQDKKRFQVTDSGVTVVTKEMKLK